MNNSSSLQPYAAQSYAQTMLINVSRLVFGFLAMLGNALILYTISRDPKIRSNLCNLLIGVLAFADFVTGFGYFSGSCATLTFQLAEWYEYTTGHCLIIQYFMMVGAEMSQLATMFIAVDRYKAIRDPVKYFAQKKGNQIFCFVLAFTVTYSLITAAFMFVGVDFNSHPLICQAGSIFTPYYIKYANLFALVAAVFIISCYIRTSQLLAKKLANSAKKDSLNLELTKQKAVFKTITVVLLVYGVCWCLPNLIAIVATLLGASPTIMGKLSPLIAIGTGLNSSLNVVVYAWKHNELGAAMRKLFPMKNTAVQNVTVGQSRGPIGIPSRVQTLSRF